MISHRPQGLSVWPSDCLNERRFKHGTLGTRANPWETWSVLVWWRSETRASVSIDENPVHMTGIRGDVHIQRLPVVELDHHDLRFAASQGSAPAGALVILVDGYAKFIVIHFQPRCSGIIPPGIQTLRAWGFVGLLERWWYARSATSSPFCRSVVLCRRSFLRTTASVARRAGELVASR